MNKKQFGKNLVFSVLAQISSLVISFLFGLVVPKFIDEYQYAYWQTYALYVSYVGLLHFGIIDGLVLRYSQFDYDQLDRKTVRGQFNILFFTDVALAVLASGYALIFKTGVNREVIIYVAIGIVIKNLLTYSTYTLQLTNRIKLYASLVIIDRFFYAIFISVLLVARVNNFALYCVADLASDGIAIIFGIFCSRELYFGRAEKLSNALKETWISASAGIFILFANWSSNLIVGLGKMIVQWHWDELLFGKVSFAFSLSNIFLTFVSAISVVLFPQLKRMDEKELPRLYGKIRSPISLVLFAVMLCYFPGCFILEKWIPKYSQSLVFLGILLPIIIYTSKVSLLTNNYLKAYRKEKLMLTINVIAIAIAAGLYGIAAYLIDNIYVLLALIVLVVMGRSIVSEIAVKRIIGGTLLKEFIIEAIMTSIFVMSASAFSLIPGFLIYLAAFIAYAVINKHSIASMKSMIRRKK